MFAFFQNISGARYGGAGFPIRCYAAGIINILYKRIDSCLILFYYLILSCPLPYSAHCPRRIEGTTRLLSPRSLSLSMETQVGDRTHNFNHATRLSHRDYTRRSTRYGAKGSAQHTISFLLRISGVDLRPEGTSSLILFPTIPPNSSLLRRGIRHCDVL